MHNEIQIYSSMQLYSYGSEDYIASHYTNSTETQSSGLWMMTQSKCDTFKLKNKSPHATHTTNCND